jgi:hypothetical protein
LSLTACLTVGSQGRTPWLVMRPNCSVDKR